METSVVFTAVLAAEALRNMVLRVCQTSIIEPYMEVHIKVTIFPNARTMRMGKYRVSQRTQNMGHKMEVPIVQIAESINHSGCSKMSDRFSTRLQEDSITNQATEKKLPTTPEHTFHKGRRPSKSSKRGSARG